MRTDVGQDLRGVMVWIKFVKNGRGEGIKIEVRWMIFQGQDFRGRCWPVINVSSRKGREGYVSRLNKTLEEEMLL